ncbi:MAG: insulinase family protein [Melioribacteraceae bacterium]|nr:MAG: insulinase family protein [Melioribacteraceae bacterium]
MLDRSLKPEPVENINFEIPVIEKFELRNGLKVFLITKNSLPIVQFNFLTEAGSKFDPQNKKGLSFLTSLLIDEGAGNLTALQLDNEIESLGSILKVSCDHDSVSVTLLTLKENVKKSFDIFSDVVLHPRFEEPDFNREQKKLLNRIIQSGNEPSYIADTVFEKLVFENSNYAFPTIGNKQTVESITNNDIKTFYDSNFSAHNSALVVVGNISREEILSLCDNSLCNMKTGTRINNELNINKSGGGKIYFIHKEGAVQSELRLGHITNSRTHKDYYAKLLMNTILGGQFSSRLNSNIREDKGFTYGISTGFYYNKISGQFEITTSVQAENTAAALIEINNEIIKIKENIFDEEIAFAKSYLIKRFPAQFETYAQVSRQLSTLIHFNLPDDYFNNYIVNIEGTTQQQIQNAALNYIFLNDLKTVVVGDRNLVLKQLEIFDKEIVELDVQGNVIN